MEHPRTRYAKSGDVNIAYQVGGEADIDLVFAPGTVSHLDLDYDFDAPDSLWEWERFLSFSRFIRFDKRGTGLSDRVTHVASLEERTDDIRAVLDAAGSERAVILGHSEGGSMACMFAATYPERTRALIIWGGQASWLRRARHVVGDPTGGIRAGGCRTRGERRHGELHPRMGRRVRRRDRHRGPSGRHPLLPGGSEPRFDRGSRADEYGDRCPRHPAEHPGADPDRERDARPDLSDRGCAVPGRTYPGCTSVRVRRQDACPHLPRTRVADPG